MQNDPNKPNRIKYLLPWIGMAAVIGLMWAAFADTADASRRANHGRLLGTGPRFSLPDQAGRSAGSQQDLSGSGGSPDTARVLMLRT
jgi:hypothetical protein